MAFCTVGHAFCFDAKGSLLKTKEREPRNEPTLVNSESLWNLKASPCLRVEQGVSRGACFQASSEKKQIISEVIMKLDFNASANKE